MNEIIKVNYESDRPTVLARDLHQFLEIGSEFSHWFKRMCEYGFSEGTDFSPFLTESSGGRPAQDAQLTIDMAKEICMLQRNERGKQARQYFIQLEKDWNSPEKVMARALQIADKRIKRLETENASLTVSNQIMQPKADYFDELVDRKLLTSFRETAKQFEVKEKDFIGLLLDKKYIYRDKKGKLQPYANKNDGLFEIKECFNDKTN